MSDWNDKIIAEFRANAGKVGGMFEGAPLVLLTTTGARTGAPRTNPVVYLRDGARILVFASNAGAPAHPHWYRNLLAHPKVTVEIGDGDHIETYSATAQPLEGKERDLLYARQAELVPAFAEYQARTERVIPVVALYRIDPSRARAIGDHLVRIHDELRQEMASLLADVEAHLAAPSPAPGRPAPALTAQLRERCATVCDALHGHHTNETERGFPLLEERFPGIIPALEQFRREHEALADIRHRVQEAVAGLDDGDPGEVRAELRRLAAEMEAHFAREERRLVTALNAL